MTDEAIDPRELVLDRNQPTVTRIEAVSRLGSTHASKETLLDLCNRHDEPEALLRASGKQLSRLVGAGVSITNLDIRDISDAAMDGFCEE